MKDIYAWTPLNRVAAFLMIIGAAKGQGIIALMDNSEIKAVVPAIQGLTAISPAMQRRIWTEFKELGYDEMMNATEALDIIRLLFNGRKISGRDSRNCGGDVYPQTTRIE